MITTVCEATFFVAELHTSLQSQYLHACTPCTILLNLLIVGRFKGVHFGVCLEAC